MGPYGLDRWLGDEPGWYGYEEEPEPEPEPGTAAWYALHPEESEDVA